MAGDSFKDYVLDQLRGLETVSARAMFGGYGLYHGGTFFGILADGRLYFKTDEESRAEYEKLGMGPFHANEKQTLWSYYEVPVDVLEDDEALVLWALRACQAQS
jgi:DNA transformation protein